ncbi:hypothetical protein L3X38_016386 [Prunus dulcis]|uniref:Uncharacterized protein n=1 Tax=Prunus dulcis TaxID=3755 RepID=A0AAD4Z861_PRUDU|nr:hypothetical protein L3X38_016386 [Prunus dulcis]
MTGASSSSSPSRLPPPAAVVSSENGEEAAGVVRTSPPLLRPPNQTSKVVILGIVQFTGETLPKFRQKVSVFSKWARHLGDVRNFHKIRLGFPKIQGGSFQSHSRDLHRRSPIRSPQ